MIKKINFHYCDYGVIAILFCVSFWLQQHLFFNWDAGWHIIGAERLLHGGNYPDAIFDDNLPMVFWFFIPSVLLHAATGINVLTLNLIIIHSIILLSFLLCCISLQAIYAHASRWQMIIMRYALLIVFLFFSTIEFAQRDTLVVLLSFPYIFLVCAKMETGGHLDNNTLLSILSGFCMAVGIAMNPFYGLIVMALEIQRWIIAKKITWHAEWMTFLVILSLYFAIIIFLYPAYFTYIIPAFFAFAPALNWPWRDVLLSPYTYYLVMATLLFIATYSKTSHSHFVRILWLCTVMSYIVFFINQKMWLGHVLFFIFTVNIFLVALLLELPALQQHKWTVGLVASYCIITLGINIGILGNAEVSQKKDSHSSINRLISFLNQQKESASLYVFSTETADAFPSVNYTSVRYLPEAPNCWGIPSIVTIKHDPTASKWRQHWIRRYQTTWIRSVIANFQKNKPDYVVVDNSKNKAFLQGVAFDYIHFLRQNTAFQKIWENYVLIKTINHRGIYRRKSRS